jgi:hypothetical protein
VAKCAAQYRERNGASGDWAQAVAEADRWLEDEA